MAQRMLFRQQVTSVEGSDDDSGFPSYIDLDNDYMNDFVRNYEKRMDDKRVQQQKRTKKGLEKFIDDEEPKDSLGTIQE